METYEDVLLLVGATCQCSSVRTFLTRALALVPRSCHNLELCPLSLLFTRSLMSNTYLHLKMLDRGLDPSETVDMHDCLQCSYQTASAFQLDRHVQRLHRYVYVAEFHASVEPEQFSCANCDHKSHYQFELYEHFQQAHVTTTEINLLTFREEPRRCDYCKYKSNSNLTLTKHHHLCDKASSTKLLPPPQESTIKAAVVADLKCTVCSYRAKRKSHLKPHMLQHAADEEINWHHCHQCSYRSKQKSHLKVHDTLKHATNVNWLQCAQCSYRTKTKSTLKTHMLQHATDAEIDWFACEHCPYRAKRKSTLNTHLMQHATNDEISWHECAQCSYRSKQKSHLKVHVATKHGEQAASVGDRVGCAQCSYRAKTKWSMKMHMLRHAANDEIDWFQCERCSYRAKRMSTLNAHMLQHATGDEIRWFRCDRCAHRTKKKSDLKRHMLQHAGSDEIDWFRCGRCSYRAKQKSDLKRHGLMKHADEVNRRVPITDSSNSWAKSTPT